MRSVRFKDAAGHRFALHLITCEQIRRRISLNDERDFPGEIERILNPGVHPLPSGRAMNVGGIAEKKDAQLAKFVTFRCEIWKRENQSGSLRRVPAGPRISVSRCTSSNVSSGKLWLRESGGILADDAPVIVAEGN